MKNTKWVLLFVGAVVLTIIFSFATGKQYVPDVDKKIKDKIELDKEVCVNCAIPYKKIEITKITSEDSGLSLNVCGMTETGQGSCTVCFAEDTEKECLRKVQSAIDELFVGIAPTYVKIYENPFSHMYYNNEAKEWQEKEVIEEPVPISEQV